MTDARSTYDESNEVWPYFILTILGVVLIPLTIGQVFQLLGSAETNRPLSASHAEFRTKMNRKRTLSSGKLWVVIIGWGIVASLISFLRRTGNSTVVTTPEVWDPYEILRIGRTATEKQIKSAYRKLSLEFHPDKVKELSEATKDEIEAVYVDISKAYRALTDEVTRDNFLQYGHPDGPQPVVHGIALPAFLFNPAASLSFIAVYLAGFGVVAPMFVTSWWQRSQKRTRRGLLQETVTEFCELLAKEQAHFITAKRIMKTILMSPDMDDALSTAPRTNTGTKKSVRANTLNYAQRLDVLNKYLNREEPQSHLELIIATESARLLLGLHEIAAGFRSFILCQRTMELRRAIIQAVPLDMIHNGEYLQLKGSDLAAARSKTASPEAVIKTVEKARDYFPRLHLLAANFRVFGESKVTTSSQVHLELKYLVLPLGDSAPELSESEIHSSDAAEESGYQNPAAVNKNQPELPDAVAPYFPEDVQTAWFIYLYGERDNKLMEKPLEVTNMDLHNLKLTRQQIKDGDDIVIGTLVLPISSVTPPNPDNIPLRAAMVSSCYFGSDIRTSIIMEVVAADPVKQEADPTFDEQDEESEEEVEGLSDIDTSSEEEDNAEDE